MDEEGIAELFMDDSVLADVASRYFIEVCEGVDPLPLSSGPGTSLRRPVTMSNKGMGQGMRPLSQSGRPVSGFLRPGTMGGRPKTMEQAIKTPRSLHTAR